MAPRDLCFLPIHRLKLTANARQQPRIDRQSREAPWLRISVVRHLRRPGKHLGLRSPRRGAQEQRQARLVALRGLRARRHGGPRRRDPDEPPGLEVLRPRGDVLGPDGRLPQLQGAPARRPPVRQAEGPRPQEPGRDQRRARCQGAEVREVRLDRSHRGAPLQPHVQDHGRRRRHRRRFRAGLPAPRDRAGDLRELRQRAGHHAPQAAVRHRADRQGVPQRDHAR